MCVICSTGWLLKRKSGNYYWKQHATGTGHLERLKELENEAPKSGKKTFKQGKLEGFVKVSTAPVSTRDEKSDPNRQAPQVSSTTTARLQLDNILNIVKGSRIEWILNQNNCKSS
jgi:hypothetical protein